VARIFINLERRSPPALFHLFGPRVVPTFNYFQTAAVLSAEGYLEPDGLARVGRVLLERAGYTARRLENSLADLVRRGHLSPGAVEALAGPLRAAGVLPRAAGRAVRWRRLLHAVTRLGRRARRPAVAPRPARERALDYEAILDRLGAPAAPTAARRDAPGEGVS